MTKKERRIAQTQRFRFCSRLYPCHKVSNLKLNILATTLIAAAFLPSSLMLIARISFSPCSDFNAGGKHSFSKSSEKGSPSTTNGMIYSSRPLSMKYCTSLFTHGDFAERGEHITIRYFDSLKAVSISSARKPPTSSSESRNIGRIDFGSSSFSFLSFVGK